MITIVPIPEYKVEHSLTADATNFFQGNKLYYGGMVLGEDFIQKHIQEQALRRAYLCLPCLKNGKCSICKCATPHMFLAPDKIDSKRLWGAMLNEEDWNNFKATDSSWQELDKILNHEKGFFQNMDQLYLNTADGSDAS